MPNLGQARIDAYRRDGYVFPIRVMATHEAADHVGRLERMEAERAGRLPPSLSLKPHLLVPWLWDMVHDPRIVEPVRSVLGPDVVCWASSFFNKAPESAAYVAWHQDATYWGLEQPDALTAWVALSGSDRENGCMRVVAGTHGSTIAHVPAETPGNMLYGGERLAEAVDPALAVDVELQPGEMSLHHLLTVHGSEPNRSKRRRVGFAIRYVDGRVRPKNPAMTATHVAGRDHGHFRPEVAPEAAFHPAALERHRHILRDWLTIVNGEIAASRANLS